MEGSRGRIEGFETNNKFAITVYHQMYLNVIFVQSEDVERSFSANGTVHSFH